MSTKKAAAPADQAQRDLILKELDCNMLVEAAAGTGKTTSMVGRMVELIAEGERAELEGLLEAVRQSDVGRFIRREEQDWTDAINEFRSFEITQ